MRNVYKMVVHLDGYTLVTIGYANKSSARFVFFDKRKKRKTRDKVSLFVPQKVGVYLHFGVVDDNVPGSDLVACNDASLHVWVVFGKFVHSLDICLEDNNGTLGSRVKRTTHTHSIAKFCNMLQMGGTERGTTFLFKNVSK